MSELGELERALAATRVGSGTTVLVAGDAGIGKTRLAAELADRAREAGFEVLVGRSIDLVGTELPYQPFVEALRPLGEPRPVDPRAASSQLGLFEETLGRLAERAVAAPVLLVLEDLHWADASTLDLVVFLAHNLDGLRVLLLGTYRADELSSAARVRRLADGVMRSGSASLIELGPLEHEELAALLAARTDVPCRRADRRDHRPLRGQSLLRRRAPRRRQRPDGELPRGLRDLLLRRVAQLDRPTQSLLRLAAAAGREVAYPLLRAAAALPERDVRESLRQAVEHGILVAEQATGSFRFRHALLAEAIYTTILPGEREELHARLAEELARSAAASPAELAPHWAAAGRSTEALAASVDAARQAEAVFGLAEALAHLERALALWDAVPDAAELVRLDLVELCSWAAELANQTGAAPRAVELARSAIAYVGEGDPLRAAVLHGASAATCTSAAGPGGARRVRTRGRARSGSTGLPRARGGAGRARAGLMLAWRYDESMAISEQALSLAASGRRPGGGAAGAHGDRHRPGVPRSRRGGPRAAPAGVTARPGDGDAAACTGRTSCSPTR